MFDLRTEVRFTHETCKFDNSLNGTIIAVKFDQLGICADFLHRFEHKNRTTRYIPFNLVCTLSVI